MIGHAAPLTWQPCTICGRHWPTKRLHDGMCLDCHPAAVTPRAWSAAYGENRWPQW